MTDHPRPIQWADGSMHTDAGGQHKETDEVVAELSGDARLPRDLNTARKRLDLTASTSAKMMRAAHQAQTALNRTRLFECQDESGKTIPPDPISARDGTGLQILKRLAAQVRMLETVPLEEDETELERHAKIAAILNQMTKQEAVMEQAVAKAVGMSTRAAQEAAKIQFQMKVHQDKMELAKDNLTAVDVEKIADG